MTHHHHKATRWRQYNHSQDKVRNTHPFIPQTLYTNDKHVEANEEVKQKLPSIYQEMVTDEHNADLMQPLTMEEVT